MKTRFLKNRGVAGNTLLLTLMITGLIGFLLATYLSLVRTQNMATIRSQAWNATIPVVEAGIEDALMHLNTHGETNLACDGWQYLDGKYIMQRHLGDHFYIVSIFNSTTNGQTVPVITSQGYVSLPVLVASARTAMFATVGIYNADGKNHLGRGVRCAAKRDALFTKGLVAKGQIDMNGNNILTDSFDSLDSNHNTNGRYDPNKRKDNGDVATNSGLIDSLNIGNANIFGRIATGPNGSHRIGNNGAVGTIAWQESNSGLQPGYHQDDMNVEFPDVQEPFSGGAFTPGGETIGGVTYKYVLANGNYELGSLSMSADDKMLVTGNATLYVPGDVSISGNAYVQISAGAVLKLYVAGASASLTGNGVVNQAGNATNFYYYGLPGNTSLSISGNGEMIGVVYAPNANLSLSGGGNSDTDFSGASISKSAKMNGHFKFHYDEALAKHGPNRGFVVTSWDEMVPTDMAYLEGQISLFND